MSCSRKRVSRLSALSLCVVLLATPNMAYAEQLISDEAAIISSRLTTTVAVLAVAVPLTAFGLSTSFVVETKDKKKQDKERREVLKKYTRLNRPEVNAALALGGGPALHDMATLMDLPPAQRASWFAKLRANRRALLDSARVVGAGETTLAFKAQDAADARVAVAMVALIP